MVRLKSLLRESPLERCRRFSRDVLERAPARRAFWNLSFLRLKNFSPKKEWGEIFARVWALKRSRWRDKTRTSSRELRGENGCSLDDALVLCVSPSYHRISSARNFLSLFFPWEGRSKEDSEESSPWFESTDEYVSFFLFNSSLPL